MNFYGPSFGSLTTFIMHSVDGKPPTGKIRDLFPRQLAEEYKAKGIPVEVISHLPRFKKTNTFALLTDTNASNYRTELDAVIASVETQGSNLGSDPLSDAQAIMLGQELHDIHKQHAAGVGETLDVWVDPNTLAYTTTPNQANSSACRGQSVLYKLLHLLGLK